LLAVVLFGVLLLFGAGLAYFIFVGVRAIYRSTAKTARAAGHGARGAGLRATVRMAIWAAFFGVFYAFLYFLGRSIGWWAVLPGIIGCAAMIFGLLQADRLLTIPRSASGQHAVIALTIIVVLGALASVTWLAAASVR
jgi:hypothetical protein